MNMTNILQQGLGQTDPTQNPQLDQGNTILRNILQENKGLAKVHSPENTNVVFASPERQEAAKKYFNGAAAHLEYWPSDETGEPEKNWIHPSPGKNTLEVYNPKLQQDPTLLKGAIYGDLMHGMSRDATYNNYRNEFMNNFTPEELERQRTKTTDWLDVNQSNNPVGHPTYDAYIRGWLGDDAKYARQAQQKFNNTMYSPKQLELLDKMQSYIKTGK